MDLVKKTKAPPPPDSITGPATRRPSQEFYQELDSYRHRSGCLEISVIVVIFFAVLALVGWYLHTRGVF